jgi:hypothetical protein
LSEQLNTGGLEKGGYMPATLVIRDGDPHWWASPDIWVVPGADPNGTPGPPIAGQPAYIWAQVRNTGKTGVSGARVDFYWSNPATGVLRSNSTLVGSAFVDLAPGDVKDVLGIVPWIPTIVNEGHECLVAEVIHSADPLPTPPPDAFDPPTYHQIAQKNLTVLVMRTSAIMVRAIQIAAPARTRKHFRIALELGGAIDRELLVRLGLEGSRPAKGDSVRAALSTEPGCEASDLSSVELKLEPGAIRALYLKVATKELKPRTYVPIHVVSRSGDRVEGGITFLVVSGEEE